MKKFLSALLLLCVIVGCFWFLQDGRQADISAWVSQWVGTWTDALSTWLSPAGAPSGGGSTSGTTGPSGSSGSTGSPSAPTTPGTVPVLPQEPSTDADGYGYYYSCLTEADARLIYRTVLEKCYTETEIELPLYSQISACAPTGEAASQAVSDAVSALVQPALDALLYDHPSLGWISMGDTGAGEGGTSTFSMSHVTRKTEDGQMQCTLQSLTFFCVANETARAAGGPAAYAAQLKQALEAFPCTGDTVYEKLRSLQQGLCDRITYDLDAPNAHTAWGALMDGRAVCDGYAKALKLLCDQHGIPCLLISGTAVQDSGQEAHAWNYVQMEDGRYYAIDVTWDDREGRPATTDYFLVGANTPVAGGRRTFSASHLPSGIFSHADYPPFPLPSLAQERYTSPTAS